MGERDVGSPKHQRFAQFYVIREQERFNFFSPFPYGLQKKQKCGGAGFVTDSRSWHLKG